MSEKIGVKRWYTVQVMSGQENRVVESLTNRHQRNLDNGVDDGMEELLLPTKKVIERKDKKEYVRQQKQQYLLVLQQWHFQQQQSWYRL